MKRALLLAAMLSGCSAQPSEADEADRPQAPVQQQPVAPVPAEPARPFSPPTTTLPKPLLGTWTADPDGKCAPATELRIVVTPDAIRFYEGVTRIISVTQTDPHNWVLETTTIGEGETRSRRFSLYLGELGGLTRVEPPAPDLTYARCPDADR